MTSKPAKRRSTRGNRFTAVTVETLNASEQQTVLQLGLAVMQALHQPGTALTSSLDTRGYLRLLLGDRKHEVFGVLYLDNQHRVIETAEVFCGTIDGASVHPRVIVQQAMTHNAAAVILFHNHPSGVAEPSMADEQITRRLSEALSLVDVRVLDHIVVTAGEAVSFAERGLL